MSQRHAVSEQQPAAAPLATGDGPADADALRQRRLPLPWQLIRTIDESDFAHPAEFELARILTFYRVRWVYEPTTFPLPPLAGQVNPTHFTPDFYLPDHDLYIELTTMRQPLVTRKNRKLRRFREHYPGVQIKLLYRRDYKRIVESHPQDGFRSGEPKIGSVLFSAAALKSRIGELGAEIASRCAAPRAACLEPSSTEHTALPELRELMTRRGSHKPAAAGPDDARRVTILASSPGSSRFVQELEADLASRGCPPILDRLALSQLPGHGQSSPVRVSRSPRVPIAGRDIILATDVISTGLSLAYLRQWLLRRGARSIQTCVLLDRREARLIDLPIDYVGFDAPNELMVGFGLSLHPCFGNLPYIAALSWEESEAAETLDRQC